MIGGPDDRVREYVFPIILAAAGIGVGQSILETMLASDSAELLLDEALRMLLANLPITEWGPTEWSDFLVPIGRYVITYVIPHYGAQLFADEVTEVTAEVSDPIGWGLMVASLTATAADLVATTADILQSPPVYVNTFNYTMEIQVTLLPDSQDPMFPQVATSYDVIASFSNPITERKFTSNAIPPNAKSLPPVVFDDIPAGGIVTVTTVFYSDDG